MDITDGKHREVIQSLGGMPGVTMVDMLEGPPDILVVVEAGTRRKLAELTVGALSSVESYTENLQLLPGRHSPGVYAAAMRRRPSRSAGDRAPIGGT
jgi:hypothetical protein